MKQCNRVLQSLKGHSNKNLLITYVKLMARGPNVARDIIIMQMVVLK